MGQQLVRQLDQQRRGDRIRCRAAECGDFVGQLLEVQGFLGTRQGHLESTFIVQS